MPKNDSPADLKTLRLASPGLTPALLETILRYLERVLERSGGDPLEVAKVRQASLDEVGLSSADLSRLTPMLTDFCGRRWTAQTLRSRLESLREKEKVALLSAKERAQLE